MALQNAKGQDIPFIGLGTFPFEGEVMANMINNAVIAGYKLFDTADDYRGESGIGIALKNLPLGFNREDLFLQTKISDNNAHKDDPLTGIFFNKNSKFMQRHTVHEIVHEKVCNSLREMNIDYIDSLLIHYPFPDYMVDIWEELIDLKQRGIVRYIGVSNFHECHIDKLIHSTGVCPDINEIYVSPIAIKQSMVEYCKLHDIHIMAYSPLMDLASRRINSNMLQPIADKYGKTIAQIILRWNVERNCIPLPKSKNPNRLIENYNIWNFSLTPEEVNNISSLNYDYQYLVESKICPGI